jgi:cyclic lactone autoinducer peptide
MKLAKWPWKAVGMMAGVFALIGANTTCWWIAHQPKKPEELLRLQKF